MNKLFYYEPGFVEDSVIYEIKLKEVARLPRATLEEVEAKMDELGVGRVVIEAGEPTIIERIKLRRHVKKLLRRPRKDAMTWQEHQSALKNQ